MAAAMTKTITLTDLAKTVNRLIVEEPDRLNPTDEDNLDSCLYFDQQTNSRCLIGQALFELSGRNVPSEFEETGINMLFLNLNFCDFFNLEFDDRRLLDEISQAQRVADNGFHWGQITPINIPA